MSWRIQSLQPDRHVSGPEALLSIIACHEAWRRLTPIQRHHLTAAEDGQLKPMHGNTRRALVAHGICDEQGVLTPAGRDVLKYRPKGSVGTVEPTGGVL